MDIIDIKSRRKRNFPKPHLTLKLLQEHPNGLETAIVYPFPPNPSSELLEAARLKVLDFLDFNSGHPVGQTKEQIAKTLVVGFNKLLEIALLLRDTTIDEGPSDDSESLF